MQDFDNRDVPDDDGVEITDLDSKSESSSTSLSLVLLRFVRKIPFLANTHAKNTALALLICVTVLLFLVQPGLPSLSRQTSSTLVPATSSSVPVQSPSSIVYVSSLHEVTWIEDSNGIDVVRRGNVETVVWQNCRQHHLLISSKTQRPILLICR
jgi:hypothetical protein